MNQQNMMEELERKFNLTVAPLSEFYGTENDGNGIWVRNSEDAVTTDYDYPIPLFSYYAMSNDYICGVFEDLYNFLEDNGWHAEAHDAGTYMLYKD